MTDWNEAEARHLLIMGAFERMNEELRTPQGEPALTYADGLPGTREPVVTAPQGNAGESPALVHFVPSEKAERQLNPMCGYVGTNDRLSRDPKECTCTECLDWLKAP